MHFSKSVRFTNTRTYNKNIHTHSFRMQKKKWENIGEAEPAFLSTFDSLSFALPSPIHTHRPFNLLNLIEFMSVPSYIQFVIFFLGPCFIILNFCASAGYPLHTYTSRYQTAFKKSKSLDVTPLCCTVLSSINDILELRTTALIADGCTKNQKEKMLKSESNGSGT